MNKTTENIIKKLKAVEKISSLSFIEVINISDNEITVLYHGYDDISVKHDNNEFYYETHNARSEHKFNGDYINDILLEKYFMKNYSKNKQVEKIISKSKIELNKKLYFMLVIQNQDFQNNFEKFKTNLKKSKYFIDENLKCGNSRITHDVLWSTYRNENNLNIEQLKNKYLNKILFNDSFEQIKIKHIFIDVHESDLNDFDKYDVIKLKIPKYYLENKDGCFIIGTEYPKKNYMSYDIFCELIDQKPKFEINENYLDRLSDDELRLFYNIESINELSDDGIIGEIKNYILENKKSRNRKIKEIKKIVEKIILNRWSKNN